MQSFLRPLMLVFALFFGGVLTACTDKEAEPQRGPVVMAASSLEDALVDIAADWTASGKVPPQLAFASSAALARQIENGAPGDLFLSADMQWAEYLVEKRLTADTEASTLPVVASNRLVIVGPKQDAPPVSVEEALAGLGKGLLAIADPAAVPAGRYGKAGLEHLGLWQTYSKQTIPAENVRAALALVERGEAELGIVYASDAAAAPSLSVRAEFPEDSHAPIVYPALLLKGSTHKESAEFLRFLTSEQAQKRFAAHGFGPPPAAKGAAVSQ